MMRSKDLVDALIEAGYEPRSYSGRCMFGKSCVGVSLSRDQSEFELGVAVGRALGDSEEIPDSRSDQLGLGSIVYFPYFEWNDDCDAECSGESDDEDDGMEDGPIEPSYARGYREDFHSDG